MAKTAWKGRVVSLLLFVLLLQQRHSCVYSLLSSSHTVRRGPNGIEYLSRLEKDAFLQPTALSDQSLLITRKDKTQLAASPTAWALGHVLGGVTGTPVVARATSSWYKKINLPSWTPPDRIFAPVWTALYASMGVAASRVARSMGLWSPPMVLWWCHYALNLLWAPIFFGAKRLRLGLIANCLLTSSLGVIIPLFYSNNQLSGLLLLPYMAWLLFATILNAAICKSNPTEKGYNEAMLQADLYQLQKAAAEYAGVF